MACLDRAWAKYTFLLIVLLAGFVLARAGEGALRLVAYPLEANFGEGVIMEEGARFGRGDAVYGDINEPPFWSGTYPPLGHALLSTIVAQEPADVTARVRHNAADHPHYGTQQSDLHRPRLLALMYMVGAGLILVYLVFRTLSPLGICLPLASVGLGFMAMACWVTSPFVGEWAAVARIDAPGRFLGAAAILLAVLAASRTPAGVHFPYGVMALSVAAALLAALALFTKQSLIAAGITVCLAPLLVGRGPMAAATGATYAVAVAVLYTILHIKTDGWSTHNLTRGTARGLDLDGGLAWWSGFLMTHGALLAAIVLGWRGWIGSVAGQILAIALLAGLPHAFLAANSGADRNYFFDMIWPLCGLAALSVWQPGWRGLAALFLVGGHLAGALIFGTVQWPTGAQTASARQLIQELGKSGTNGKGIPRRILSEYPQWSLALGSRTEFLPYLTAVLEQDGRFNSGQLVGSIRKREFEYILMSPLASGRFPKWCIRAIGENYEPFLEWKNLLLIDLPAGTTVIVWRPKLNPSAVELH